MAKDKLKDVLADVQAEDTGVLTLSAQQLQLFAQGQMESEASTAAGPQLLSTRGGRLTLKGQPIAGDAVEAIILCAPIERLYYDGTFDATALVPPACSAMALNAKDLVPDGNSVMPQSAACIGCPKDQWGSAGTPTVPRKGKACRETRRIVFLTADDVQGAADVRTADAYAIRPPVTSIQAFSELVKDLARTECVPTFGAVVKIALVPDAKNQFRMTFTKVRAIKDLNLLTALMDRATNEQNALLASVAPGVLTGELVNDTRRLTADEPDTDVPY